MSSNISSPVADSMSVSSARSASPARIAQPKQHRLETGRDFRTPSPVRHHRRKHALELVELYFDRRLRDGRHPFESQLAEQIGGYCLGGGIVEDQGGRQLQSCRRVQAVAQFDRGERVKAELFECLLCVDRAGVGCPRLRPPAL